MPAAFITYTDLDPSVPLCSECNSSKLFEDRREGNVVCTNCGNVVQDYLFVDDGQHYKTDDNGVAINVLHGAPINPFLAQSSMSTMIGYGSKCSKMMRILHQQQSMPSKERSLYHKFKEIKDAFENKLKINSESAVVYAQEIWKDLKEKKIITKGEKNVAMVACCVYYGCRLSNIRITRKDIIHAMDMGSTGSKKFKQATTILLSNVQDKYYYPQLLDDQINPDDYVTNMVSSLKIPDGHWNMVKEVRRINTIVENSEKMANPQTTTVLATIIFIAAHSLKQKYNGDTITLDDIATIFKINVQTLKNKLKIMASIAEISAITQSAMDSLKKRKLCTDDMSL